MRLLKEKLLLVGPSSSIAGYNAGYFEERRRDGFGILAYSGAVRHFKEIGFKPDYFSFIDPNTISLDIDFFEEDPFLNDTDLLIGELYENGFENFYKTGFSCHGLEGKRDLYKRVKSLKFLKNFRNVFASEVKRVKGRSHPLDNFGKSNEELKPEGDRHNSFLTALANDAAEHGAHNYGEVAWPLKPAATANDDAQINIKQGSTADFVNLANIYNAMVYKETANISAEWLSIGQTEELDFTKELFFISGRAGENLDKFTCFLMPLVFYFFKDLKEIKTLGFGEFNHPRYREQIAGRNGSLGYDDFIETAERNLPLIKSHLKERDIKFSSETKNFFSKRLI